MHVHDNLEAGPEKHIGSIDVGVHRWDLAALKLKRKMLVETDAEEDAEAVHSGFSEGLCEGLAQGKRRFKDLVELSRNLVVRVWKEKFA